MKRVERLLTKASRLAGEGKPAEAERSLRKVISTFPMLAPAHFVAGEVAEAREDLAAAIEHYGRATDLQPGYFEAWLNLGACLRDNGDARGAIGAYRRALRINPRSAQAYNNLGSAYLTLKDFGQAVSSFRSALDLAPGSLDVQEALARIHLRMTDHASAFDMARSVLDEDPSREKCWEILGACQQVFGQFEDAEASLAKVLELDPGNGEAHFRLATMKRAPDVEQRELEKITAMIAASGEEASRVGLHFAAARMLERRGDFDKAFAFYQSGNALRAAEASDGVMDDEEMVNAIIQTFTPELFRSCDIRGSDVDTPIFIVGMPRSGTTLVEQIIGSHRDVASAGELTDMFNLVQPTERTDKAHGSFVLPSAAEAGTMAKRYLGVLTKGREGAARVTDKLPFNFLMLGMIRLLFPRATIIHCRRDPIDTCLSCFSQSFLAELTFTHTLEDLARYYRVYHRLMTHWANVLPHPMLHVDYEEVIAQPEAKIRELIAFCGLPWDDACLEPHRNTRSVMTASLWQVRQPIYRTSIRKWKKFEKHLGPLIDGLADLVQPSDGLVEEA